MHIEQIYTGCLAQGAYYIESEGEAAIIDPLREVTPYLEKAKKDGAEIKYIFETHFHADFVSGHITLSEKTGAPIIYGPNADPFFDAIIAKDGQEFTLGNLKIKVLHTPGHTMESSCYLLKDENGKDIALFSGDTLFLGDVGRPDLAQKAANMTKEQLAGKLYDSLRSKIMPLNDDVIVYPAHGAGSACGKNMMKETMDTLGNQKKVNYALKEGMGKEEFVQTLTKDLLPPPGYFPMNVKMNREGYADVDDVIKKGDHALDPEEFENIANNSGAVILDVRHENDFVNGHIPRSVFIGLDGDFAPWVGALIKDVKQEILLVAPENKIKEAITRLSRIGFDNTIGYLEGGIESWKKSGKEVDTVESVSTKEFEKIKLAQPSIPVVDVRREAEYNAENVPGALNFPLTELNEHLVSMPEGNDFFVHCAGGYRSVIAASILKSRGIHNVRNIEGGFDAIKQTKIPTSEFVCPTSVK